MVLMSAYDKSSAKVGRKRIADDEIVPVGAKFPSRLKDRVQSTVKVLNDRGYETNNSEVIRVLVDNKVDDTEAVVRMLRHARARQHAV